MKTTRVFVSLTKLKMASHMTGVGYRLTRLLHIRYTNALMETMKLEYVRTIATE